MKKRMIVTTAAALCLAAALGAAVWWFTPCTVANNEKYTITIERGKWILRPGPELEAFYPSCDPSDSGGPEFRSVEEMQRGIRTGEFSRFRLYPLFRALFGTDKAEILPLSALQEPALPEGAKVEQVQWTGQRCRYLISGLGGSARFSLYMDETGVRDSWVYFDYYHKWRDIATETEPERGAAVTHLSWATVLTYELQTTRGICPIMEQFPPGTTDFSHAVPTVAELFWEEDGLYHAWHISNLTQRPSVELLTELAETKWK